MKIGILLLLFLIFSEFTLAAGQSSSFTFEPQYFFNDGLYPSQRRVDISALLEPSFSHSWEDQRATFDFTPFYRWDSVDGKRTHFDLRDLSFDKAWEKWEFRFGIRKVFWGKTESRHLVDVINQTDWIEDIKGSEKLGQPMINGAWVSDAGTLDLFYLPYFRTRTFPGDSGRFRFPLSLDESQTTYEYSQREWHPDWAMRWSTTKPFDYGVSYFEGTNREPDLRMGLDSNGSPILYPYYSQMRQLSLDLQYTQDSWLWKFEGLQRWTSMERFFAGVGGFEYTISTSSGADWGLLLEFGHDDRTSTAYWLKDYFFGGVRIAFNDLKTTEILGGVTSDLQYGANLLSVEIKRKLAENLKAGFETLSFWNVNSSNPFYTYSKDNYGKVKLEYFF